MENVFIGSGKERRVLLLQRSDVESLLTMAETIDSVEESFKLLASGKAIMPPKLYLDIASHHGDFRAMPAFVNEFAGMKWVSVYPDNHEKELPVVMATIILNDPHTGETLAIMDGTYITEMRTGAAGGIAARYLARKNAPVIGIVGAGVQARTQLMAVREVMSGISMVKVYDKMNDTSSEYAEQMRRELDLNVSSVSSVEEASDADIVITTTPSMEPVVKRQFIKKGTHINAIGADAAGKQELEGELLKNAKLVVDEIQQCSHSGEINMPLQRKEIGLEDIYGTLPEIVSGARPGRENDDEITIFDSTGLAIQDIACARVVYEKALG